MPWSYKKIEAGVLLLGVGIDDCFDFDPMLL